MELSIQIYSLLYSFFFGIIFYFLLDIFNKYCNKCKLLFKIILSFLFVILNSSLYFLGLMYINNGYLHIYFLIFIMVGYIVVYLLKTYWFTRRNKISKM